MEILMVDPLHMQEFEGLVIPAGTLAVVPSQDWDEIQERWDTRVEEDGLDHDLSEFADSQVPTGTIVCMGQMLDRKLYPELALVYADGGGFYAFQLPDLRKRFMIGVNSDTNETLWGDGIIYYQAIPHKPEEIRDIRQVR